MRNALLLAIVIYCAANCVIAADTISVLNLPGTAGDPERIDYASLPTLKGTLAVISPASLDENVDPQQKFDLHNLRFELHNYLAWFDNRFWCIWSDGPPIEDEPTQEIRYATSVDGLNWSESQSITGTPTPPYAFIARGLWIREGELLALAAYFKGKGAFGADKELELRAYAWDAKDKTWKLKGKLFDNAINNFPPQTLPSGDWILTRRDARFNVSMLIGGRKALDDWQSFPVVKLGEVPGFRPDEPIFWPLPDGTLYALFRDNSGSRRLFHATSTDEGRTWSPPVPTNFPNATSKLFSMRTSRGYRVLVSNANPKIGRRELHLSISEDGRTFTRMARLDVPAPPAPPGLESIWRKFRGGVASLQYPHVTEHEGQLLIAFSRNKKQTELLRVPLDEVENLRQARVGTARDAFDVVIVGGTPGGISAAIAAARLGCSVALIERHDHIGGMATSGLGKSDIENRAMIGGLFREFIGRVRQHYVTTYGADHRNVKLCRDGYYYEPSVAESVFEQMLREQPGIAVLKGWRMKSAHVERDRLTSLEIVPTDGGSPRAVRGQVFIDATYEGDLYAASGAEYRLGRESREEFGEPHAGVVYYDYQAKKFLDGTTGEADDRLPAYTYRLCLTTDPENAHRLTEPPPDYDRTNYIGYFDDLRAGRLAGPKTFKPGRGYNPAHFDTLVRALSVTELPNHKTDVNINPRPLGFPFVEENRGYVEGDEAERQRIRDRLRSLTLGLLWFLQNDAEVPEAHRALANEMHLPQDEFADTGHFPFQLYVREARRLVGAYMLTEHDITGDGENRSPRRHTDSIAVGEFPIDSFPCRKRQPSDTVVLEGYLGMLDHITRPYEIPYRIMIPKRIDGLIVPVAASTTHVAYSSIRMEPTWMALGQAAGVAAQLSIERGVPPRDVPVEKLQRILRQQGQVLSHVHRPSTGK